MISSARPIKNIHVSAFNGSQSLWCRWITRASDYRFHQKRLQMPSGNPHCIRFTQRPRNGQKRASLPQCQQHCGSALFRRLVISPSRPSIGPFTQPLHRRHRTAMLSLRRARRIRSFFEPALRIHPFFAPPPPPFFAPARRICPFLCPPPSSHPHAMQVALYSRSICSSMRFTSCLVPPPRPLPECSLISCSFLEASAGLRCRPPPTCSGAPGAVLVCFADHCFILRTMRQR